MSVDKDELENALRMFKIQDLRRIISDRDLSTKSRETDELIDALLSDEWSEDEFESLLGDLANIQRETSPLGYYIMEIKNIQQLTDRETHEELQERLLTDVAKFSEDNELTSEGFEVSQYDENELLAIYWTQTTNYTLDPLRNLRPKKTIYNTGFRVDFNDDMIFIETDLPGKAQGLKSTLEDLGMILGEIGHQNITNDRANSKVNDFVDELESSLDELDSDEQSAVNDYGDHQ